MAKRLMLKNVRISFPSLATTEEYNGKDTGKYAGTFLIDKGEHPTVEKDFIALVKTKLVEKYGSADKIPSQFKKIINTGVGHANLCLRDGDDSEYDGYKGCFSLKASNSARPRVLDKSKNAIDPDVIDSVIYSGCRVNVSLEPWIQDNQYGKKINCNLMGVQFNADDEPFGSGGIPSDLDDDFEAEEIHDSDFDDDDEPAF